MPQHVERAVDSFADWVWELITKAQEPEEVGGIEGCCDAQAVRFVDAIVVDFVVLCGS
jgi:hypothetical protein